MKRFVPIITAILLVCIMSGTALAAEISDVVTAERPTPTVYPTEVTEYHEGGTPRIRKVYTLTAVDDPTCIPTAHFEREEYLYTLLDMTRQDLTETNTKEYSKTVTVESKSNDMEQLVSLFAPTLDVTTGEGYAGILTLDPASIEAEVKGYGTSTRTVTATRTYPALSDADTSYLPKTTTENGRTLDLADVQWQEGGNFYTATATYTGNASSRYATGYTVTATYTGEVSKTTSDEVLYTAIFGGTPIQTAEQEPQLQTLALLTGAAVLIFAVIGVTTMRKKGGRHA